MGGKRYVDALEEFASNVVSIEFGPAADAVTRRAAADVLLAEFATPEERAASGYSGLSGFTSAVADGNWEKAAFAADRQNQELLVSWIKFRSWAWEEAVALANRVTLKQDGIRYIGE